MRVHLKGCNSCNMRRQKLAHYADYFVGNGHEIVEDPAQSEAVVFWTCAFREDVLNNSLRELHRYRESYSAKIYAAGCLPDIAPGALDGSGITLIPWRQEQRLLEQHFDGGGIAFEDACPLMIEDAVCEDAARYRAKNADADVTFHDQFIKVLVSEGCPFKCTYCTERIAFPAFRSFPRDQLADRAAARVAATGHTKLILISDCLGEYGKDIGSSLPDLMRAIRVRDSRIKFALNNFHPTNFIEYSSEMHEFIGNGWIEHLNLPIQSGSDSVLAKMNRRYTVEQLRNLFGRLAEEGFRDFDTHIIVGFPGETNEDLQQTVSLVLEIRPRYVLLSKYLESPRAPSAQLPDKVSDEEARLRMSEASRHFVGAGIICNWEGSDLAKERLRRLNFVNTNIDEG